MMNNDTKIGIIREQGEFFDVTPLNKIDADKLDSVGDNKDPYTKDSTINRK